jgi:putative endonuclease
MSAAEKRNSYHRGLTAEHFAATFLRFKGYSVLERRFKTPVGEIDLIVRRKNTIVFVEVKERNDMRSALECLTPQMRSRIVRAAQYYIAGHPACSGCDLRFDLIATRGFIIRHLDNAWQAAA